MDDLNNYFVTMQIYKGDVQVHSITVPKSMISDMFYKWKFPGSQYDVHVIDHTGNFRINSTILNPK
jgi:hypothetical protein